MKERLSAAAYFEAFDRRSDAFVRRQPSKDIVAAVLARGEWPGIRPITGIVETPSMPPNGTIIESPGYDPQTGFVFEPSIPYPPIPTNPTRNDACNALRELATAFADFPVTSDAGRYVPIAGILTLVGRPAIAGAVPGFFFDASTRGSGKGLQARCVSVIAQGRECAVTTWPGDRDEAEKILGAYALRGANVVLFDNVVGRFGGGALDKVLTCSNRVSLRVLGKSEQPELPWRAVVMATGKNAELGADTARRVLIQRLEPTCERPEDRNPNQYAIPRLELWCTTNHTRLVVAALTVLRAYVLAGRPPQGLPSWGSFEPWCELVANAIAWAGGPNVLEARATVAGDEDEATTALRALLKQWVSFARDGVTVKQAIDALYTADWMRGATPPDGWDELREAIETLSPPPRPGMRPQASKLSYSLRGAKGRVLDGLFFESRPTRPGAKAWFAVKVG
jgi:hypothetical protein